ncbi:hypothetical protein C1646_757950 [Rhizophagus diaphanus]|nr:hypothetical protein C1646_757950 [Rhizophagus diaphanus] [Rhizophagus sp. MUCL 43196]
MSETIGINVLVISAESENLTKRRIITLATTLDNTIDHCRANNPSDLKLLKQLNTELVAENAGLGMLRRRNAEKLRRKLGSRIEELEKDRANTDAENTKLKSRVGELDSRFAKVEQDSSVVDEQPQNERIKEVVSEAVDVSDSLVDPSSNAAEVKPDKRVTSSEQESRHAQSNNSPNKSSSNSNSITESKVSIKGEIDVEDFLNEKLKQRKQANKNLCDKNKSEKKAKGLIYDEVVKKLTILLKERSQDTESPLPDISRDSLRKKTEISAKENVPTHIAEEDIQDEMKSNEETLLLRLAIVWNRFLTEVKGQNETTSNEATPAKVATVARLLLILY